MNLDAFMDDFGRDLKRATARPPRPRRILIAAPTAVALAAVGVIALPRGDGIDAIAEARQALGPKDEIVHMVIQFKPLDTGPEALRKVSMPKTEQWYSAGLGRWRTRSELTPVNPRSGLQVVRPMEQIYSKDRVRIYDQRRDVVTIFRGIKLVMGSGGPGVAGGDPATELREQLAAGDLRDDGIVTHDGKQVRRLVRADQQRRFVYYMDPQTFAPLGGRMYFSVNKKRRFMSEFVITEYDRIPLDDESRKLLKFAETEKTKFVWRDVRRARSSSGSRPARRVG